MDSGSLPDRSTNVFHNGESTMKPFVALLLASVLTACASAGMQNAVPSATSASMFSSGVSPAITSVAVLNATRTPTLVLTSGDGCSAYNFEPNNGSGSFLIGILGTTQPLQPGEYPSGTAVSWIPNECELEDGVVIIVGPILRIYDCVLFAKYSADRKPQFSVQPGAGTQCLLSKKGDGATLLYRLKSRLDGGPMVHHLALAFHLTSARCQTFEYNFPETVACQRADGTLSSFTDPNITWRVRYFVRYNDMPCGEAPTEQESYVYQMTVSDLNKDSDLNINEVQQIRDAMYSGTPNCS